MDLWQLHIFCKVVEHKSFSKAGGNIHLSQPTISSHIKDLEKHFECRLVDRLGKEVVPTKAGQLLYSHAVKVLAMREELEMVMAEFQGKMRGKLVVGGSTIPGGFILPRLIGSFVKKYPESAVELSIGDTDVIVQGIVAGSVELGIVGARVKEKQIVQRKLIEDELRLIVPAGHRWAGRRSVDLGVLMEEPFIIREKGSGTLKSIRESLETRGGRVEDLKIVASMGSTTAVCQGIKNGVGVSILSPMAVAEELKAGTMLSLAVAGLNLKRNFYLTEHKQRSASPLGKAFRKFIQEEVG